MGLLMSVVVDDVDETNAGTSLVPLAAVSNENEPNADLTDEEQRKRQQQKEINQQPRQSRNDSEDCGCEDLCLVPCFSNSTYDSNTYADGVDCNCDCCDCEDGDCSCGDGDCFGD